ncbi:MAG: thioredoxin family protein [Pseudomonadota bacterium]|uniref:thioredoxin family protein n=1 Tax=Roseovarius TaxID=74030 RepID=UPI0022A8A01A|nr:thioredoxin family protein [Roseovarius sp. EGI FJ00037]MCZ0813958.1 thioredoxin family protein [Roseovarius sp. EGI FJ00037]
MTISFRGLPLAAGLLLALSHGAASAGTDFTDLSPAERTIFHQEIRESLLGLPELLQDAPAAPAASPYQDAIDQDLARLSERDQALFGPRLPGFGNPDAALRIALFTAPDCPDCARAEADLRALVKTHDLRVTLLDITRHSALAETLELDMAPSYVLPDMMLRGHIPPIVLERYLAR